MQERFIQNVIVGLLLVGYFGSHLIWCLVHACVTIIAASHKTCCYSWLVCHDINQHNINALLTQACPTMLNHLPSCRIEGFQITSPLWSRMTFSLSITLFWSPVFSSTYGKWHYRHCRKHLAMCQRSWPPDTSVSGCTMLCGGCGSSFMLMAMECPRRTLTH